MVDQLWGERQRLGVQTDWRARKIAPVLSGAAETGWAEALRSRGDW